MLSLLETGGGEGLGTLAGLYLKSTRQHAVGHPEVEDRLQTGRHVIWQLSSQDFVKDYVYESWQC